MVRTDLPSIRTHSTEAQDILQKAGLSRESFLYPDEVERLNYLADQYHGGNRLRNVPAKRVRDYIKPPSGIDPTLVDDETETNQPKENIMAKAKQSKKSAPTKAQVIRVAKLRRDGATWDEVISDTGIRTNSTGFRILLEEYGFDKYGRRGGKGTTKARGWGSASLDGKTAGAKGKSTKAAKAKGRKRVKRTKATAKK
jgi:hypothetical protein